MYHQTMMNAFHIIKQKINGFNTTNTTPIIIGLSGAQGSGKSYIAKQLQDTYGNDCAIIGLDHYYLTLKERRTLANEISPLLVTRSVPGTHDISLLLQTIKKLKDPKSDYPIHGPVFDKLSDDRDTNQAHIISQKPSLIVIEGWCIGAMPAPTFVTDAPLNAVEHGDTNNAWRHYQHQCLITDYQSLWEQIDHFFYLLPPDFETVEQWKSEQLAHDKGLSTSNLPQTDRDWVANFIQYYERLTRCIMNGHRKDGTALQLDKNRNVIAISE